jgi:hypothetical protein
MVGESNVLGSVDVGPRIENFLFHHALSA